MDHTTDGGGVVSALRAVAALDVAVAERADLEAALASAGRVQGWLDAFALRVARRLEEVVVVPREGDRRCRAVRAAGGRTCGPAVEDRGAGTGVRDSTRRWCRSQRATWTRSGKRCAGSGQIPYRSSSLRTRAALVATAAKATVEDFNADLASLMLPAWLRTPRSTVWPVNDGRLAVRTWVDTTDGMWCLHGRFSTLSTGRRLHDRIDAAVRHPVRGGDALTPARRDPGEKQDHLRALALAALIERTCARWLRPDREHGGRRRHVAGRAGGRLGAAGRGPVAGAGGSLRGDRSERGGRPQRRGVARARPARSDDRHVAWPTRLSGGRYGRCTDVRHPGLRGPVPVHTAAPRHLVGAWRLDRLREPAAAL